MLAIGDKQKRPGVYKSSGFFIDEDGRKQAHAFHGISAVFPGNTGSDLPGAESSGSGFALPYAGWGTHATELLSGWRRTETAPVNRF